MVEPRGEYNYLEAGPRYVAANRFEERVAGHTHSILMTPGAPSVHVSGVQKFPFRTNCDYDDQGFTCLVPPGHYFTMGDNRDSSSDSRYWGFVPDSNIIGKVISVWGSEKTRETTTPKR